MVRPDELVAHARFVRAVARDLVRESDVADDVAQSTLLIGLERPPRSREGLMAWIVSVARSVAATLGRRDQARRAHEPSAAVGEAQPSTLDVVSHEEIVRRVVDVVFELDEPYRTAILLRYYEDFKPGAIARRLEVPVETVRTRLKRGLARMRERLDEKSGEARGEWAVALAGALRLRMSSAMPLAVKAAAVLVVVGGASLLAWRARGDGDRMANAAKVDFAASHDPTATRDAPLAATRAESSESTSATNAPPVDPALLVRGTVVDEEERPIAGARVWVLERDGVPSEEAPARLLRDLVVHGDRGEVRPAAVTAADGSFQIEGLPLRTNLLVFEADGFNVQTSYSRPCVPMRPGLHRSAPLLGVVVDEMTGAPLADIGVVLGLGGMDGGNVRRWARTVTASDGSFTFAKGERSRTTTLTLDQPGCMPVRVACDVTYDGRASRTTARWPAKSRRECRVVDDESGAPLAGATISRMDDAWYSFSAWESDEASFCRVATTDANGNFTVECAQGEVHAVAVAPGHLPRTVDFATTKCPGDPIVVRLFAAPSLVGEVRDGDGRPVAGARLFAIASAKGTDRELVRRTVESKRPRRGGILSRNTYATSDADGRFTIDGVFDDESWSAGLEEFEVHVDANHPRLGKGGSDAVTLRFTDPTAQVVVRFDRAKARRVVTGRLLAGGTGIAGNVRCEAPGGGHDVDTNDGGEFAFEVDARVDVVELCGVARDYRIRGDDRCFVHDEVRLEPGARTRHDIVLPGRRGTIRGTLRDADGRPVAKDRVRAIQRFENGPWYLSEVITNERGEYTLDVLDLFGDQFEIAAVHGVWTESRLGVSMGSEDVDFVVPKLGTIRLIVRDASTRATLFWPSVAARGAGDTKFTLHDSSDGRRQVDDPDAAEIQLPLGTYDLRIGAHRHGIATVENVVVSATAGDPLVVDLPPKLDARFRFVVEGSDPMAEHLVFLLRAPEMGHVRGGMKESRGWDVGFNDCEDAQGSDALMRKATIGADHLTATIPALPDAYHLFALPDDLVFEPAEIDVAAVGAESIDVRVRRRTPEVERKK